MLVIWGTERSFLSYLVELMLARIPVRRHVGFLSPIDNEHPRSTTLHFLPPGVRSSDVPTKDAVFALLRVELKG